MTRTILLSCLLGILPLSALVAQCMMTPISLSQRTAKAAVIFEGTVMGQEAFKKQGKIHTAHKIKLHTLLKGECPAELELITYGGRIGNVIDMAYPNVSLSIGETCLFFANPLEMDRGERITLQLYAGEQGLVRLDARGTKGYDVFNRYPDMGQLYRQIDPDHIPKPVPNNPTETRPDNRISRKVVTINSLSPSTVPAGTQTVLTISGSGFGAQRGNGYVAFTDANTNGSSFFRVDSGQFYGIWHDQEIVMIVPTSSLAGVAGSGPIRVVTDNQDSVTSSQILTIPYAIQEIHSQDNKFYNPALYNANNMGGFYFFPNNDFAADTAAMEALERAFRTIRCQTRVNFFTAPSTPIDTAGNDNIQLILREEGNSLPDGVLGITFLRYTGCFSGGEWYWRPIQMDMIFDNATNWNNSLDLPTDQETDFESVVLHELGHCLMLAHVVHEDAIMQPSIDAGVHRRSFDSQTDLAGGLAVMDESVQQQPCGGTLPMQRIDTTGCHVGMDRLTPENRWEVRPNPADDRIFLVRPQQYAGPLKVDWYNIAGVHLGQQFFDAERTVELPLHRYEPGVYLLILGSGETLSHHKIVIAR